MTGAATQLSFNFSPLGVTSLPRNPALGRRGGDVPTSSRPTFPPTSVTLVIGPLGTLATPPEPYGTHRNAQLKTEHNNPTNTRERTTRDEKQTNQNGKLQNKRRRKEKKKRCVGTFASEMRMLAHPSDAGRTRARLHGRSTGSHEYVLTDTAQK